MKPRELICLAALTLFAFLSPALASTTWYVNGVTGSNNNDCKSPTTACKTIMHAIVLASSGDSISVAAAIYPESVQVPIGLTIVGAGAAKTIIDAGGVGQGIVVGVGFKTKVVLSRMTIRNSRATADGGGIYNCFGTLTIRDSIISGNSVTHGRGTLGYGGGIYNCPSSTLTIINTTISKNKAEIGGAICNGGTLTIINSTFSGNGARLHRAAAIANYGTLTITNSTFHGNSSSSSGFAGGILNGGLFNSSGTLVINNTTLSGNTAADGQGGAIFNVSGSTVVLQNSILANNAGGNCHGTVISNGYNLSSDDSCSFNGTGDLNDTDPKMGPLRNNGGPTLTMALLAGSPAMDAGNPNGCTDGQGNLLKTDQRGMPRPDKEDAGGCEIGAYERQSD
jgi:hypothetical protein